MFSRIFIALVVVAFTGCATSPGTLHPPIVTPPADKTGVSGPQVWEAPAAEFPLICILLASDGKLTFKGGFLFFNEGVWRINSATGNTELILGGTVPFPEAPVKEQLRKRIGALTAYDSIRRLLAYKISEQTGSIEFGGFVFYRKTECGAP